MTAPTPEVLIVGAGFAGIGLAVYLKRAGIEDFVICEKAGEVGGTWRENTYPGAACDVMSAMYSFSFAPSRRWTRLYAEQAEILGYLRRTVDQFDLRRHVRFGERVLDQRFDETDDRWTVRTSSGTEYRPRFLVSAEGPLHVPNVPRIAGDDEFTGARFHSADWDHSLDLTGKRVAVIGTGASAVQFVPRIARQAAKLTVFQRTPGWVMPKPDRRLTLPERLARRVVPGVQTASRSAAYWFNEALTHAFIDPRVMPSAQAGARLYLRLQVKDPTVRAALTPDYTLGCKRLLISNDYYPTFNRRNVSLVSEPITEVTPTGVCTDDGNEHAADVIIYGTGFVVGDPGVRSALIGRDGLTLREAWNDRTEAYLGLAVAGFPNFFMLAGPNSGTGNQSLVFYIEAQARYIAQCVQAMQRRSATRIEIRPNVQAQFNRTLQRKSSGTVWTSGGCKSWYLDDAGRNIAIWPGTSLSFWRATRRMNASEFEITSAADREPEHDYRGTASLSCGDSVVPVEVTLRGAVNPLDGRYHWYGRVAANSAATAFKRPGQESVSLTIGDGEAAPAHLTEIDQWGNLRITGTGTPPYPIDRFEDLTASLG